MIKKGQKVKILAGKDKKKEGEIIELDRPNNRAKVKGINIVKKHMHINTKFFIFSAALKEGYVILVIIAVLNSAISFYYYLKVIVFMYMKEPVKEFHISLTPMTLLVIAISAFGTIQLGIFPDPIIALAQAN
jgi:hypothetical protein